MKKAVKWIVSFGLAKSNRQAGNERAARIRPAIRKAIVFVRNLQKREVPPRRELDRGGWW